MLAPSMVPGVGATGPVEPSRAPCMSQACPSRLAARNKEHEVCHVFGVIGPSLVKPEEFAPDLLVFPWGFPRLSFPASNPSTGFLKVTVGPPFHV